MSTRISADSMKGHGETTVTIEGIVVRNKPRYGSNPEGILRNLEQVLQAASKLNKWILWTDCRDSFALTPESLELIISKTTELQKSGCIGMAMTISNTMISYYAKQIEKNINIPFKASRSIDEIKIFIKELAEIE